MPAPATTGQLRTMIQDMQIGDYITLRNNANVLELGGSISGYTEIPATGRVWGDWSGYYYYYIKVEKGLLIADRVRSHSVSWDTLNSGKNIQGLPMNLNNNGVTVSGIQRSLTGGVGYADANGNRAVGALGNSGWPEVNEWDKYIKNGDLNGRATPNNNNVWNHDYDLLSGGITWVQETPAIDTAASTFRVRRSKAITGGWSANVLSSGVYTHTGLRPVFEYKEV